MKGETGQFWPYQAIFWWFLVYFGLFRPGSRPDRLDMIIIIHIVACTDVYRLTNYFKK